MKKHKFINVDSCIHIDNTNYTYECRIFGGCYISVEEGQEPNLFWRTMQYLILGHKWRKLNQSLTK